MKAHSREHYELMAQFEHAYPGRRHDREPKDIWPRGRVYQDGNMNDLFWAYQLGYAYAEALAIEATR